MDNPNKGRRSALLLASVAAGFYLYQLHHVVVTDYVVKSDRLPDAFDGLRILLVSDLHNNRVLCESKNLLKRIGELAPDLIAVTGDLVDSRRTDFDASLRFCKGLSSLCDVYYVPGNHESALQYRDVLFRQLADAGICLLQGRNVRMRRGDDSITLSGIHDPYFDHLRAKRVSHSMHTLLRLRKLPPVNSAQFRILLAHRPEFLPLYADFSFDLVLTGHAHGGQWNLPLIGPCYAPGQGPLPTYTSGIHKEGDHPTQMVVSRGLGNSMLPLRINNPFELVLVTCLKDKTASSR